jgi:hypothetical protein
MSTLWITYAWADNADHDVDFIAQQLIADGITVNLDRWTLAAGRRLWEQIESFITDASKSDAWMIYATQNSLASAPCKEELAYALERAIHTRGDAFPLIALFPSSMDRQLIPASIRVRLFVSLAEPEWKERIVAAVEHRSPLILIPEVKPYVLTAHPAAPPFKLLIEVRPRAGTWNPFVAAVPPSERDRVGMEVRNGPRHMIPALEGLLIKGGTGVSTDGDWFFQGGFTEATPTNCYYLFFREIPSRFGFGQLNTPGQFFIWIAPNAVRVA